jgi:hypothetical protein
MVLITGYLIPSGGMLIIPQTGMFSAEIIIAANHLIIGRYSAIIPKRIMYLSRLIMNGGNATRKGIAAV